MIHKTLQNIHWERRPRGRCTDEQVAWDITRGRARALIEDDDDDVSNHKDNNEDDERHSHDNDMDFDNLEDDVQLRPRAIRNEVASQVHTVERNVAGNRKLSSCVRSSAVI